MILNIDTRMRYRISTYGGDRKETFAASFAEHVVFRHNSNETVRLLDMSVLSLTTAVS